MPRHIMLILLLVCLPAVALGAEPVEDHKMTDPLARHIACTGTMTLVREIGPLFPTVSIFSVPEPDGKGERLYVAHVKNSEESRDKARFWPGPVAARWSGLRRTPDFRIGSIPTRYRFDRLTVLPGGRMQTTAMELNLEHEPPLLLVVGGGPGQPEYLDSQPLGGRLPMNESLEHLVSLDQQKVFETASLRLVSYRVRLRRYPSRDWKNARVWEFSPATHLLALCRRDDPNQAVLRFLPTRHGGWDMEKVLATPAKNDPNGTFTLQMVAGVLEPGSQGRLYDGGIRYRVEVSLGKLDITEMARGLYYEVATDEWVGGDDSNDTIKDKAKP